MPDSSLTIRVSRSTHELLRDLASKSNATITAVVDEAVHDLRRKKFWADFNAACEAAKADPVAWADLRHEDSAWEATLADGLEQEKPSDEHQEQPSGKARKR
ncbi:toxin-antitoxin system protein [Singulisphaera rosea]